IHQLYHNPFVEHSDRIVYLTYFNAGLRIVDIADARLPRVVGYFIPPDPTRRYGPLPKKLVVQSEDVLVDARGYIYLTDENQGLWIRRYTGARWPPPRRYSGADARRVSFSADQARR